MLITENILRKIIEEEYKKLQKEASWGGGWSGRRVRGMQAGLYGGYGPGGASDSDAALQTLYSIFKSKTEAEMEAREELRDMAKELYERYVKEFGQEVVDKYIDKHNLDIIHKYQNR